MDLNQALQLVNQAFLTATRQPLTDAESAILRGAWQGQTYGQIAETYGYSENYLQRDIGPKFWKSLSKALDEPVGKTNFRSALERYQRLVTTTGTAKAQSQEREARLDPVPPTCRTDWGEVLDVSQFYGRSTELTTLTQWIVGDPNGISSAGRCRLVALLGMGGIGKTALSVKLANQLLITSSIRGCSEFEYVIWRSLRNAPPLEALLADLIPILSDQQDTQADLNRLMHYLRSTRCLLILDNLETILQGGDRAGQFRAGYEGYGELLRMVSESNHQSCLLLTSREKPAVVAAFEGVDFKVRSLSLSGSEQAAQAILQAKGLSGSDTQKQILCDRYDNSPLAMKIVASSIQDLFDGEIEPFLNEDTFIFNGIRRLFDQQFDRLSALEKSILYWLAVNREWTTIAELHEDIVPAVSKAHLLESLESLCWRSLIEKQAGSYTHCPVVMEYITERLIGQITTELQTLQLNLFLHHALLKTTVKDYVRESQERLILGAIANEFNKNFRSIAAQEQQIIQILTKLRQSEAKQSDYGVGNLINLCNYLQINLTRYNFSGLTIRYACLQKIDLHQVNFADANLTQSVFTQTLGNVLCVCFSPDGKTLATGDDNNAICLWRVADSQPILTLIGHTNWIWSVAFSPNGQFLASGSEDRTVKLWDLQTGNCLKTLQGHTNWVWSVAFSPDGQFLVSSSADQSIRVWNASTGELLRILQGHSSSVFSICFSADGQTLASGNEDQTIKLWDIKTGQVLKTLQQHTDLIRSVAFSADGETLASGSEDQTIKLWDIKTGQVLKTLQGHKGAIWSVRFSPDHQIVASGGEDQTIRFWNAKTGQALRTLQGETGRIWSVAFNPNGQMLASGSLAQTAKLWDVYTGNCLKTLQGHNNSILSIAFSDDGQTLVSGGADHTIRLWDVTTGNCLKALHGHNNRVWSVVFSPNGKVLASGGEHQAIRLWDVQTGQCFKTLRGHANSLRAIAFNPNGHILASSSQDQTIKLWDLQSGQCLKTLQGHTNWVRSIVFLNSHTLASGSLDKTIRLWDLATGNCLKTFQVGEQVFSIAFNPNSSTSLVSSQDQTIKLWDLQTGHCLKTLLGHTGYIWSIALQDADQILASGSEDQTVRLWDLNTGHCLNVLRGHTGQVWSVALSPNRKILASGSEDETVRLWDMNTGEFMQTLRSDRPYEGMNITGVTGITEAQKATLRALGAIETATR